MSEYCNSPESMVIVKEMLSTNYCNLPDQLSQAQALISSVKNPIQPPRVALMLRTNDRKSIHAYELTYSGDSETIARIPFWHSVGPSTSPSADSSENFFRIMSPDGFDGKFGFITRQGVENVMIHGSGNPIASLLGLYAKHSELPEILGDSYALLLYENTYRYQERDKEGNIITRSYITEPVERSPKLLSEKDPRYSTVENTLPEDIIGIITIRDWQHQNMTQRLKYYRQQLDPMHIPIERIKFCLCGKNALGDDIVDHTSPAIGLFDQHDLL